MMAWSRSGNFSLVVNGQEWSGYEALRQSLQIPADPLAAALRFYTFWKDHRYHASSGLKAQQDTLATLNFWGYTLCDEDTRALARFFHGLGIAGRPVPLNGHVAGEYLLAGKWSVIDGDQNAVYLQIDNRTPASGEDLRADPFLAGADEDLRQVRRDESAALALQCGAFRIRRAR
jgi:hypothetical protein